MGVISDTADTVWRNYETNDPLSGSHKPVKSEIRALFDMIDADLMSIGFIEKTPDSIGQVPFRVIKSSTPLAYAPATYNSPATQIEWSDSTTLGANISRDGIIVRHNVFGDGSVVLDSSASGGASQSVWRGTCSTMNKTGDGSAHTWTSIATLGEVGAVGYNELGLFIGTGTNTGSIRGTVHGSELLVRDGTGVSTRTGMAQAGGASTVTLDAGASAVDDAYKGFAIKTTGGTGSGQYRTISAYSGSTKVATVDTAWSVQPDNTTTFDIYRANNTYLLGHISRNARYFGGSRKSISFAASAEGTVQSSSVLEALSGGIATWNVGIDFTAATFNSGRWAHINRGVFIGVDDGTGIVKSMFGASSLGVAAIMGTSANEDIELRAQDATVLFKAQGSLKASSPVHVRVANILKQVTEGAADSAGAGFKQLRVPNT